MREISSLTKPVIPASPSTSTEPDLDSPEALESQVGFSLGYRPSLDGLRGISIALVVLVHSAVLRHPFGFIGVDVFFVLSGFLITCLLLQEWKKSGRISLRAFYMRRALRLLPALFAVLLVSLGFWLAFDSPADLRLHFQELVAALFYFMNWKIIYGAEHVIFLRHTWSLCIEEQFYLLWPLTLLLALRRGGLPSALPFVLLAAFLAVFLRIFLDIGILIEADRLYYGLDTRADSLLLGCSVAALLIHKSPGRISGIARHALNLCAWLSVGGVACIGIFAQIHTHLMHRFGWLAISLCTAIVILHLVTSSGSLMHKVLEQPALRYLGRVSYGLYLWHWPVMRMVEHFHLPKWQHITACLILIPAVTIASFHLLEQPCLRLKRRYERG